MSVLCGIFIEICRLHKHQTSGGNVQKCGTELLETNYPISFQNATVSKILNNNNDRLTAFDPGQPG